MQLKRRPDLRECAELLSPGGPVKGNQETHQEIGPTRPSNLRGWKGQRENRRDVPTPIGIHQPMTSIWVSARSSAFNWSAPELPGPQIEQNELVKELKTSN
jgi:hypothetical protein